MSRVTALPVMMGSRESLHAKQPVKRPGAIESFWQQQA